MSVDGSNTNSIVGSNTLVYYAKLSANDQLKCAVDIPGNVSTSASGLGGAYIQLIKLH